MAIREMNKVGAKCQICEHPRRSEIELRRNSNVSLRKVAREFEISEATLFRHMRDHFAVQAEIMEVIQVATAHNPLVALMTMDDQMDMVLAVCARMVERLQRKADDIEEQGNYVGMNSKGDDFINPILPELRSMVGTWGALVQGLMRTKVSAGWLKLEQGKMDLMERCMDAALDAAGVEDVHVRQLAYVAIADQLRIAKA